MASLDDTGDTPPLSVSRLRVASCADPAETLDPAKKTIQSDEHAAVVWCTLPIEVRAVVAPGVDWRKALTSAASVELHRLLSHLRIWAVDFFVHEGVADSKCRACDELHRSPVVGSFDAVEGLPTASEALARARRRTRSARDAEVVDIRAWRGPRGELVWRTNGLVLAAIVGRADHWLAPLRVAATRFFVERSTDVRQSHVGFDRS